MFTRRLLHHESNRCVRAGDFDNAVRGWIALLRSAPHDFDARLRLADTLLAARQPELALPVYVCMMRESANAGHPLKALVVVKILQRLQHPEVGELLGAMANRYSADSPSLGKGVRVAPPDPDAQVPQAAYIPGELTAEQVLQAGAQVGASREGLPAYPEKLAPIPLLSDLPRAAFVRVLDLVTLIRPAAGESIVREGDVGDSFFMLARGSVKVTRGGADGGEAITLATLGEGSIFGELAILSKAPRGASVSVHEDADLLVFGRDALIAAAGDLSVLATALDRFARERLVSNLLATHPLFRPFDRNQRRQLAERFDAVKVASGTVLIREGDAGKGLFLVLTGEVEVSKQDEERTVRVASLHNGDVFGEIALLEEGTATATVTASMKTTVLFLERDVFARLIEGVPELREYFLQLAELRTMDTNLALAAARDREDEVEIALDELVMV